MKKLIVCILFGFVVCAGTTRAAEALPSVARISDEKAAEIRKMLRLTGMEKMMSQMISQMISTARMQQTGVPDEFWKRFEQRFDSKELIALVLPLYDKYYTTEDLKGMNAFYESPTGQKVLSTMPQLMQESMKVGQDWGKRMGERIAQELQMELKNKKEKPSDL